jgi:peptidoglycan-N-acetylglucosamine deacetylase
MNTFYKASCWFFLVGSYLLQGTAYAKELAITFDDSPRQASGYFDGETRSKKLIDELRSHRVKQVAFFSVSKRLDKEGIERLNRYAQAGHIIANHTHSHPNFNQLSLEDFSKDFLLAHNKLQSFDNYKKLFRFPYLREGDTRLKRDGMRKLLQHQGYQNAYITLNNYDWYIEVLFQRAIKQGEKIDMDRMKAFYVDMLTESIEYYDQMAVSKLGRSPKHVLLLHEIDINALYIGDLIDELRRRGWKIISPLDAYQDEIAKFEIDIPLHFNPGRIGEIAREKGQKKELWHTSLNEKYLDEMFAKHVLN